MADIRIKDLTTTASSTASDDFIAVDGTTNGTRKLNAFSPTFGGNATVTGTLTANSTFASTSSGTTLTSQFSNTLTGATNVLNLQLRRGDSANGFSRLMWNTGSTTEWSFGSRAGDTNLYVWDEVANAERLKIASSTGNVSIASTTASTTTSTGALVVGNGTSGGLGVGGAASIGGPILVGTSSDVYLSRVGAGILDIRSASSPGTAARLDVTGTTSAGVGFRQSGTRDWFISAESAELRVTCGTSGSIFAVTNGNPVALRDTTASTSTSSGALVVSGGVGVAGAIYAGGSLNISGVGGNTIAGNTTFSTGQIIVSNAYTPASASAAGTTGSITWDNAYIYVCVATNTWKRVAISTWA